MNRILNLTNKSTLALGLTAAATLAWGGPAAQADLTGVNDVTTTATDTDGDGDVDTNAPFTSITFENNETIGSLAAPTGVSIDGTTKQRFPDATDDSETENTDTAT